MLGKGFLIVDNSIGKPLSYIDTKKLMLFLQ